VRAAAAGVAILLFSGVAVMQRITGGGQLPGSLLFAILSWTAFVYCLVEGIRATADCLSEEKREGTIGLLFLTDLKGYDVVLGKLAAASLNPLYSLLAALPLMAMSILLGGVTAGEFWRMTLVLIHTLLLALACGIVVSARSQHPGRAWGGAFALLTLLVGGPPAGLALVRSLVWLAGLVGKSWIGFRLPLEVPLLTGATWINSVSPAVAFSLAFESSYARHSTQFWWSLPAMLGTAGGLVFLASWRLPRWWQESAQPAKPRAWWNTQQPQHLVMTERRRLEREHLMEIHPVVWLVLRTDRQRFLSWALAGLAASLTVLQLTAVAGTPFSIMAQWVRWPLRPAFQVWVAFLACRLFADARAAAALELLLITPLTSRDILRGQWLALRRVFLWPAVVILAADLAGNARVYLTAFDVSGAAFIPSLLLLYQLAASAAAFVTIGLVGTWLALSVKKPNQAAGLTILLVVLAPVFAFCVPNLVIYMALIFWAKGKLEGGLRERIAA
jgi:hypothetical protein